MSSLRKRSTLALGWDLFGTYAGQIISLIISIFLARLLEPAEFGLVGMSMVFVNVLNIFADVGFASALIQNKDNTSVTYSSVFYINVLAGLILTAGLYVAAPFIGDFYNNDQITGLVRLLSIQFLLSSFNIVQRTILRKQLDFRKLAIRGIIAQSIAGVVAVGVAFSGFGVYALVVQSLLAAALNTLIIWKVADWRPRMEFSMTEVKKLTGFSFYVFAASGVRQIMNQLDALVIGKLFSPATLGFFTRANSLNNLINKNSVGSISRVFFPVLSEISDDDERFKEVYLKVINIVAGVSVFLTGIMFLCGEELIITLFGEKWEPSVFIFRILIVKGLTFPVNQIIVNAFLAKGKSKENFYYGNIRKSLALTPFIVAFFYGFSEYLYAIIVVSIVAWILNNFFVMRSLNIPFEKQMNAILPYLLISIPSVGLLQLIFPAQFSLIYAFIKVIVFIIIFFVLCNFFDLRFKQEIYLYKDKVWIKLKGLLKTL